MSTENGPQPGRYTLIGGTAIPDAGTLLAELAAAGHRTRHAGPGSDPLTAIGELFRSPHAQVPDGPLRAENTPPALAAQAAARLNEIFPGEHVTGEPDLTRAGNGLASALPHIAAILLARPGTGVLLEHPETGLHPGSQTALTRLACRAAAAGANIAVTTHFDHVLNATRLAIASRILDAGNVSIRHYRLDAGTVTADSITAGPDGMLNRWPEGFFDEYDKALYLLSAAKRNR